MKFGAKAKVTDPDLTDAFADEFRRSVSLGLGPWKVVVRPNDYSHMVATYTARSTETVFQIMREYMARDIEFEIQIIPQRLWRSRRLDAVSDEEPPALEEGDVVDAEEVSAEPVGQTHTLQ